RLNPVVGGGVLRDLGRVCLAVILRDADPGRRARRGRRGRAGGRDRAGQVSLVEFLFGVVTGAHSLDDLIRWGGYVVLVAIVFTETGLLVGFFLPGDSLLITAGLVAAAGSLDIWLLNALLIVAAVAGDSVGYAIGYRTGPRIFRKEESRW